MKARTLLLASLLISAGASAQVTLQGSALNGWMPNDSTSYFANANLTATPNGTWDLSSYTGTGTFATTDDAAINASFPLASYKKSVSYGLANVGYISTVYWGKDNNGVYWYGEHLDRQAYSISSLTMNTSDSLIFPLQAITYSAPGKVIAFPMSFGSTWNSVMQFNTDFQLIIAMYGMSYTPGQRRTKVDTRDSVKGWGKMRLKGTNGKVSAYMDVLVVQEREYNVDSFYLGGSPAPAPLLSAFGLTQGQVASRFTTKFYRSGEVTPLFRIDHSDSTFTSNNGGTAMINRLAPDKTGIGDVAEAGGVDIYPNPVNAGGLLHIHGLNDNYSWNYMFTSLNGKVASWGSLQGSDATINISGIPAGVYTLTLLKNGKSQGGEFVIVQ